MKKKLFPIFIYVLIGLTFLACKSSQVTLPEENFKFQILQLNDVYEISPLEGGKVAGMARVATLRDELIGKNPHTLTVMAGDFLSPSLIGTLKEDGQSERIQGLHMVETMNALGMDYVTFGNHEFDISEEALQERINASDFEWFSCNVRQKKDEQITPFQKIKNGQSRVVPDYIIHEFENAQGKILKLGLIGTTLPFNQAPFVHYEDEFASVRKTYESIKDKADIILIISHLEAEADKKLAELIPEVPLIIGGHDHINMKIDTRHNYITKADANAKTVYVHYFQYDFKTKKTNLYSELKAINAEIPTQTKTQKVVDKWQSKAHKSMLKLGYEPEAIVVKLNETLDGREATIRYEPTLLGKAIAKAMLEACPEAQIAFINSGSVRIDDQLSGQITQTDILRILPFGGDIRLSTWTGADLLKVLDIGLHTNKGIGGYLQYDGLYQIRNRWYVGKEPIDPARSYKVVVPSFLAEGREANLDFLKEYPFNDIDTQKNIQKPNDIRHILIHYLQNHSLEDE